MSNKLILPHSVKQESETIEVEMVILRSADGENWDLVKPEDIPVWIKGRSDVIEALHDGQGVQRENDDHTYIARPVDVVTEGLMSVH